MAKKVKVDKVEAEDKKTQLVEFKIETGKKRERK